VIQSGHQDADVLIDVPLVLLHRFSDRDLDEAAEAAAELSGVVIGRIG